MNTAAIETRQSTANPDGRSPRRNRILLVATADSDPLGAGWHRRVHQIEQDLKETCGAEVVVFNATRAVAELLPGAPSGVRDFASQAGISWLSDRCRHIVRKTAANPARILWRNVPYSTDVLRGRAFDHFKQFADASGPFDAAVFDNSMFSNGLSFMSSQGVPCFYALHHLESMAYGQDVLLSETRNGRAGGNRPSRKLVATSASLADEIAALSRAEHVFAISPLEHEFLSASGIASTYYPYRPEGGTLEWCRGIRAERMARKPSDQWTFVSTGSRNPHNLESLAVMLRSLLRSGMPGGSRLLVTGISAEDVGHHIPDLARRAPEQGIHLLGKVPEDEFDEVLISAAAMTIPGYAGFGALTRFADAAECGIPVLTNVSPRVSGLEPDQFLSVKSSDGWRQAMEQFIECAGDLEACSRTSGTIDSENPFALIGTAISH